ncbi:MAG TPA: D-2-hydroxyacid dehydrogenase [Chloroflexota bacterium]|nr:D-2-hydroxyacid dehydrogenase [Chloroflexota bacterium]
MTGKGTPRRVLVGAATIDEAERRWLTESFPDVRFTFGDETDPHAEPGYEVIFAKGVDTRAIDGSPRLRWYQAGTAGVERVLAALAARPEVAVTNARGAHGIPMAENVLTMALCFATRMHRLIRTQPQKARIGREVIAEKWELHGQTMLVLGLGDIGGTLAEKAKALGMRVLGVRRSGEPHGACEAVYTPDRLREALPQADHVAACLPLTGETRAILGEAELRLLKPTAHVYNVGRGASLDGRALRRALAEGWIAGAGLDCVDPSDVPADDDVLWGMENVILSHHTSGSSPYNACRIADIFARNLRAFLDGRPLENVVSREKGY